MTKKSRWLVLLPFVLVTVLVGCWQPARAAMSCGPKPENVPSDAATQINGQSNLILKEPRNAALRGFVTAKRRELRQKYPDTEASTLDSYLLWVTCQAISGDHMLAATEQFDEYSNFYRLLSEPIAKPAAHAE